MGNHLDFCKFGRTAIVIKNENFQKSITKSFNLEC
jgi:hypothetical protein